MMNSILPNFFSKYPIPKKIPEDMEKAVSVLKKTRSKPECLKLAYDICTQKFRGGRALTYLRLYEIFYRDIFDFWNRNGFLHCHHMNYVLRILLVWSGKFTDSDISWKWTAVWWVSPHQYLVVKTPKPVIVDLWGHDHGIKFGDYGRGFHKS